MDDAAQTAIRIGATAAGALAQVGAAYIASRRQEQHPPVADQLQAAYREHEVQEHAKSVDVERLA